ncbi:hypothetical protein RYR54_000894 [Aeromonas sobria]|nr:hypothetical protein [Aeromonas sobria]
MKKELASSCDELTENSFLIKFLLQQQQYDDALLHMDKRLILIERLVQIVKSDPTLKLDGEIISTTLLTQEKSMIELATRHHKDIFMRLADFGRASKVEQAYRLHSKEL